MGIDPPAMREMVADYYNSLARLDACVGELLATLEKSGKASNTIVIYIGDHGADFLRGKRTS
jgi:N-sulfoglucosamine sulfohydrolase